MKVETWDCAPGATHLHTERGAAVYVNAASGDVEIEIYGSSGDGALIVLTLQECAVLEEALARARGRSRSSG